MKYIVITPAYNEENHIEFTLKSIIKQTVLPIEWIIVNDGSTDNTAEIVSKYSKLYDWIKLFTFNKDSVPFGEHVHSNFYKGFSKIVDKDWDVVVKLDADLDIDRNDFFEYQLNKMQECPKLGICSGITYSTHTGEKVLTKSRPYWHTGGAMKVYRRECFTEIGGIKPIYGWDGLDEYQAMFHGWKTRTFFDLHVNHLGKKRALSREKKLSQVEARGMSLYQRGYPTEFAILKCLTYLKKSRAYTKSFYQGYFGAKKKGVKPIVSKKEAFYFRKLQYMRVLDKFTKNKLL